MIQWYVAEYQKGNIFSKNIMVQLGQIGDIQNAVVVSTYNWTYIDHIL